jgi:hypothetical protein
MGSRAMASGERRKRHVVNVKRPEVLTAESDMGGRETGRLGDQCDDGWAGDRTLMSA